MLVIRGVFSRVVGFGRSEGRFLYCLGSASAFGRCCVPKSCGEDRGGLLPLTLSLPQMQENLFHSAPRTYFYLWFRRTTFSSLCSTGLHLCPQDSRFASLALGDFLFCGKGRGRGSHLSLSGQSFPPPDLLLIVSTIIQ